MMKQLMYECDGPKTQLPTWDPDVYAGCIERIDNWFQRKDLHWQIEKPELLQRVKEWNKALEKYCDDKGLSGATREEVIQKHTANPLAPCANWDCEIWETGVKDFQRCSQCHLVVIAAASARGMTGNATKRSALNYRYE
jgi:hypothetical protein